MKPLNFEESLVWYTIIGTYGLYLFGAQPIVIPIVAWILVAYLGKKVWQQSKENTVREITISSTTWLWMISMCIIVVAIIIGNLDFNVDTVRLMKSVFKWTREHALWGLLPLVACLNIRPKLIYRAVCILCAQSLIVIPICYLAYLLRLPTSTLYVSPLAKVGGNSPDLYSVVLYFLDYDSNQVRLALFSPWAPNLALISLIYFFIARQETNKKWRRIGMIGALAMVLVSVSRAAILSFPVILLLTWLLTNFTRPGIYFATGIGSFLLSIFSTQITNFISNLTEQVHGARATSSEARINLIKLSLDKWWNEAPIWGHGYTEPIGPAIVYFLPVGTSGCGTWVNLLYTKGLVGFMAFAVPFLWSLIYLVIQAQRSAIAKTGLSIILVFFFFSFTEELDLLAYLYWPGLLMLGIALRAETQSVSTLLRFKNTLLES
ncbi:O-antigen ligase family protein [Gloeocapsopsis crepidinum LEGE 06123]|uniref:O-antigen ligase family protein n=2 Tax=Gloeocapsopsis crepidinum TaxID=693223 RepID=A0ABR9UYG5_9CHRO|nr:O-antigen ligase family protein [Gloeocapsopsis crepidinum LEGE 06123]